MNRETLVWTLLLVVGAVFLVGRAAFTPQGMGKAYVRQVPIKADDPTSPDKYIAALPREVNEPNVSYSAARTIGLWVAAFFTLSIFSFLYRDNVFYKLAESIVVGVSAAYWMVYAFWESIIPNLLGKLWPRVVQELFVSGHDPVRADYWYLYFVPLVLGIMLLWRLSPKGGWIARWPLAFVIGTFMGMKLTVFLHADFLSQINSTIIPLIVTAADGSVDWKESVLNLTLILGVMSGLVYFFFSIEHTGVVGKAATVGIWFLMITFGASFGYTVMGRIALLAARMQFLLDDWLWLIDPTGARVFGP